MSDGLHCDRCGNEPCLSCFDRDEDGEYQDAVVTAYLCEACARQDGYCIYCGQREESASKNESGFCDECQVNAIREENADDPEPEKNWEWES